MKNFSQIFWVFKNNLDWTHMVKQFLSVSLRALHIQTSDNILYWTKPPYARWAWPVQSTGSGCSLFSFCTVCVGIYVIKFSSPSHSPEPPLSPSFILLSPLKFILKIYSVMAIIFPGWKWTHTLPPPHSPLSPSFILLCRLKFIQKIYSVMVLIFITWERTATPMQCHLLILLNHLFHFCQFPTHFCTIFLGLFDKYLYPQLGVWRNTLFVHLSI